MVKRNTFGYTPNSFKDVTVQETPKGTPQSGSSRIHQTTLGYVPNGSDEVDSPCQTQKGTPQSGSMVCPTTLAYAPNNTENEDEPIHQNPMGIPESGSMARRTTLGYTPNGYEDEDDSFQETLKALMMTWSKQLRRVVNSGSRRQRINLCLELLLIPLKKLFNFTKRTRLKLDLKLKGVRDGKKTRTQWGNPKLEVFGARLGMLIVLRGGFRGINKDSHRGWRVVAPPQTRPTAIPKRGGAWNPKKQLNPKLKFFYCVREGFKPAVKKEQTVNDHSSNDQSSNDQTTVDQAIPDGKMIKRRKRASCRCGCNAELRIKRITSNKYMVYKFVEKHNHCLVREDDIKYLRTCRKLTYPKQLLLHQLSNVNLGPVRSFKVMKEMYGGFENIGATSVECKNFRRGLNHFIGNRDAHMVVQKLLARVEFCPGVSIEYLQDENDKSLVGLFWATRQRSAIMQRLVMLSPLMLHFVPTADFEYKGVVVEVKYEVNYVPSEGKINCSCL
ncbi:FAR1 DNA binding domain, zinc finger, SWIM-type, MULE transposase domain containing protein, partial [Tanacetum coccineum]